MPQLRKDPILGRWVIIATERAKRPEDFKHQALSPTEGDCPFCAGKEDQTSSEVFSLKDSKGNWKVRITPSRKPFLEPSGNFWKKGLGPYDLINGIGYHETIIETPSHIGNMADLDEAQIKDVFSSYCSRMHTISNDSKMKYVLVFKNYGSEAGAGLIKHSRSQLIATPVNLKRVKEELEGAKLYYNYHERCIFCDLMNQELTDKSRIVLDENGFVAIVPFASRFPFEIWVMPKKHQSNFCSINETETFNLAKTMKKVLTKLKVLLNDPSYNYVIHTAPFKRSHIGYWSTIEEDFHWHIEITPRLTRVAGFEWGTGFYICPSLPEESAKFLREI